MVVTQKVEVHFFNYYLNGFPKSSRNTFFYFIFLYGGAWDFSNFRFS